MGQPKERKTPSDLDFLPNALSRLGLRPPLAEAATEEWDPEDAFEVYSPDGVQIFRGLGFLSLCSYTLENLFTHSEEELFSQERDAKIF